MTSKYLIAFALVLALLFNAKTVRSVACDEAVRTLIPCLPYLTGLGPAQPTAPCCAGVDTLNKEASSTQIRRDLCECLEKAATSFGVNSDRAKELPQSCGIATVVPIDPKVQCSSIPWPKETEAREVGVIGYKNKADEDEQS